MKKSLDNSKPTGNNGKASYSPSIEAWRARDRKSQLSCEAGEMLNKSIFDVWNALQEAMGLAFLVGADSEQLREELRQMVEWVEPKDA